MDSLKPRQAFTLIELLTVMAIIALMLGISMYAFRDMGRGSGMRAAVTQTRSSMTRARQNAITHRKRTRFTYGNTDAPRGYYYSWQTDDGETLGGTNYLPLGFIFKSSSVPGVSFEDTVEFKLDGSCNNSVGSSFSQQKRRFSVTEDRPNGQTNTFVIYAMTGRIKVSDTDE